MRLGDWDAESCNPVQPCEKERKPCLAGRISLETPWKGFEEGLGGEHARYRFGEKTAKVFRGAVDLVNQTLPFVDQCDEVLKVMMKEIALGSAGEGFSL